MNPILKVSDLVVSIQQRNGEFRAVDGVDIEIARGQVLGLVGESGSGKTLTGLALMGLLDHPARIAGGRIVVDGTDLTDLTEKQLARRRGLEIAMVLQDPMMSLNPTLTIEHQMTEALTTHHKMGAAEVKDRVVEALEKVGIGDARNRLSAYPHQFSGGMRQRVAIATAMLNRPKLLIADEPTTALDVTVQAQILREVRTLCAEYGTSLLWITHDLAVVADLADEVAVMYAGQIVESGTLEEILDRPRHPYTAGLIASVPERSRPGQPLPQIPGRLPSPGHVPEGCRFRPRCSHARDACHAPVAMRGDETRRYRCLYPLDGVQRQQDNGRKTATFPAFAGEASPAIEVRNVTKTFRRPEPLTARILNGVMGRPTPAFTALNDVSFRVREGGVLGVVGESGSGKSTIGRIVAGLMRADSGQVIRHFGDEHRALDVQMIFQDAMASMNPRQRIGDAIAEAPVYHGIWKREDVPRRLASLLEQVGIDPAYQNRYPHQFSGGQRQRISIARALAVEPKVLVCDEAVASLDVSIQAQIINLFAELRREFSLTYVFIGHDLGVVSHLSDDVIVMFGGRIVESGPARDVLQAPVHPYARALVAGVPSLERRRQPVEEQPERSMQPADPGLCPYLPRCTMALPVCNETMPALTALATGDRSVACHLCRSAA